MDASGKGGGRARRALVAGARGLALAVAGFAGSLTLFVLSVLSIVFIVLGVGVLTTPGRALPGQVLGELAARRRRRVVRDPHPGGVPALPRRRADRGRRARRSGAG